MILRIAAATIALLAAQGLMAQEGATPIDKDKLSYAIGYQFGTDLKFRNVDVDLEKVIQALRDAQSEAEPQVPQAEMVALLKQLEEEFRAAQLEKFKELAEENKEKATAFLDENKSKKNIVVLPSGVQYRIIEDGDGSRPTMESEVIVHYRSSTMNGLEYDSSFARGEPVSFKVSQVLKGWQEILPLMKVGAKWQIFVPPEMGYGLRGQPPVGPNEVLVFDINLVEIKS
ncbi:MAG: FKBP-type peptidyl-prolyl cis-trans isomerase [Xanthomonadales bacterium]|nr:FKBP-type peptidyl-prolyl cis-trans isomerase [Xanthomonadales bacterium]